MLSKQQRASVGDKAGASLFNSGDNRTWTARDPLICTVAAGNRRRCINRISGWSLGPRNFDTNGKLYKLRT